MKVSSFIKALFYSVVGLGADVISVTSGTAGTAGNIAADLIE